MAYLIKVKTLEANKTPKMREVETLRKHVTNLRPVYNVKTAATMPLDKLRSIYRALTQK